MRGGSNPNIPLVGAVLGGGGPQIVLCEMALEIERKWIEQEEGLD